MIQGEGTAAGSPSKDGLDLGESGILSHQESRDNLGSRGISGSTDALGGPSEGGSTSVGKKEV